MVHNISDTISEKIKKMIDEGVFQVNEKLPSQIKMAKKFNVSLETYRAAIKILEKEEIVISKHGLGTYVIKPLPNIDNRIDELRSVGEMIKNAGLIEEESQESIEVIKCDCEIAQKLSINAGDEVLQIKRYRIANGSPVAYSINYMSYKLVGEAFQKNEFKGSLFGFLRQHCNIEIFSAYTEFLIPDDKDAISMKISNGTSNIVLLKQLHYSNINEPVLYSLDYLRNDVFKFHIRRYIKN